MRFDGVFIMFSELAPDGRTVAAFEYRDFKKRTLTLLTPRRADLRKVVIRGLPKDGGVLQYLPLAERIRGHAPLSGRESRASMRSTSVPGRPGKWPNTPACPRTCSFLESRAAYRGGAKNP